MNILKNAALILVMATSFAANSVVAVAEEAPSASSAVNTSEIIAHIEKGLAEVGKSDFSAAQVHLKAARFASDKVVATSDNAKKAHAVLMQGQIQAKKGDVQKATEELNKALELYKSL